MLLDLAFLQHGQTGAAWKVERIESGRRRGMTCHSFMMPGNFAGKTKNWELIGGQGLESSKRLDHSLVWALAETVQKLSLRAKMPTRDLCVWVAWLPKNMAI